MSPDSSPDSSPGSSPHSPDSPDSSAECEHDWQVVNHDENRDIYKCTRCGALKRE